MTIGIGVVGSGLMGRRWAEIAASLDPRATLVGVTGGRRAPGLARDLRCRQFDSVDALLAAPGLDCVVIASPPAVHHQQAVAAATAGKHVLVEKPMATSADECRLMLAACAAAGVRLSVVSQHRFRDAGRCARDLVDAGAIGRLTMAQATGFEVGWWDTAKTQDEWKLDPRQQSAYAGWAAHACDLLHWFVGTVPERAFAVFDRYSDDPPPGRSAMATYHFAGGAMAHVWMSYDIPAAALASPLRLLLVGTDGALDVDSYGPVRLARGSTWETVLDPGPGPGVSGYPRQLDDVLDAIEREREPAVDGRAGLVGTAMLEAAETSAREETVVRLALEDRP